jgi:hypothetical protein
MRLRFRSEKPERGMHQLEQTIIYRTGTPKLRTFYRLDTVDFEHSRRYILEPLSCAPSLPKSPLRWQGPRWTRAGAGSRSPTRETRSRTRGSYPMSGARDGFGNSRDGFWVLDVSGVTTIEPAT